MKITNNTTSSGVFSQQPPVRLAEIPRKCTNCERVIGDEVEYGGQDPLEGDILCAGCLGFVNGNDLEVFTNLTPKIDKFDHETAALIWKQLDEMEFKTPREYQEYANILCKHHKLPFGDLKLYEKHFAK